MRDAIFELPAHIKLYILSRTEPPAELIRQQANCRLSILGWQDLRLQLDETRQIARTIINLEAPEEVFVDLQTKIDGWMAGLLLLLKRGEFDGVSPQLLSRHTPQEIFDYLSEESYKKLMPEIQNPLLRLAFLPQITIQGAERITQCRNSARLLQNLQRNNTFLNRLTGHKIAYRFHPLMQSFLQEKARQILTEEKFRQLLSQSAQIAAAEEDIKEAVGLYVLADNVSAALDLLLSRVTDLAQHGRFDTVENLISIFPKTVSESDPWLIYWQAACRLPYLSAPGRYTSKTTMLQLSFLKALSLFEAAGNSMGSYIWPLPVFLN